MWLINFLFDSLREQDHTENIGAAIALALMLRDEDDGLAEFKAFLVTASPEYQATVLGACTVELDLLHSRVANFQKWLVELVIELLTKPTWYLLGADGVSMGINILIHSRSTLQELARKGRLNDFELGLLFNLTQEGKGYMEPDADFGFLKGSYYRSDWESERNLSISVPTEKEAPNNKGILDLLFRLCLFATQKTRLNLLSLVQLLSLGPGEILSAIPFHLTAMIPIETSRSIAEQLARLVALTDLDFDKLVRENTVDARVILDPYNGGSWVVTMISNSGRDC